MKRKYRLSEASRLSRAARMKALNADPEFKAQAAARMKALHADPEFKAQAAARMKALNADRRMKLTTPQRKVYQKLRNYGIPRDAAYAEACRT